ncbi:hypothetical protein ES705_16587 [subsurface metagenome]
MIVDHIDYDGMSLNVGDEVVFNNITMFDNAFNGKIKRIQIRKNSYSPIVTVSRKLGNTEEDIKIQAYMIIRKGNNGKGLSTTWD